MLALRFAMITLHSGYSSRPVVRKGSRWLRPGKVAVAADVSGCQSATPRDIQLHSRFGSQSPRESTTISPFSAFCIGGQCLKRLLIAQETWPNGTSFQSMAKQ
jgi:hypothetical protein